MDRCAGTVNVDDDGSRCASDSEDTPVAAGTARACCLWPPIHGESNIQAPGALPLIVQDGDLKHQPRRFGHHAQGECVPSVLTAEHDRVDRRGRETTGGTCRARGGRRGADRRACRGVEVPDEGPDRQKPEGGRRSTQPAPSLAPGRTSSHSRAFKRKSRTPSSTANIWRAGCQACYGTQPTSGACIADRDVEACPAKPHHLSRQIA